MKILIKILAAILGAVLLVTAALSVFVHYYFTDKRIKNIMVPKLENTLAREVQLEGVKVSLWKGVTLKDFVILEADGQDEFVRVGEFNLSYDLLPLLQKQLQISRIVLNNPRIRVVRYANGKFNFESLKPLSSPAAGGKPGDAAAERSAEAALPLALTVSAIKVRNADLTLRDELKEIPAVTASADGSVSLETGKDPASLKYSGKMDIEAEAIYKVIETSLTGGGSFDQDRLDFNFVFQVDDQEMTLSGTAGNYLEQPDITCNLESDSLNLDNLLSALGGVTREGEAACEDKEGERADKGAGSPVGTGIPEGLKAQGKVRVDRATCRNVAVHDFRLDYRLRDKVLHLQEMSADAAEGSIAGRAAVDLDKLEPDYNATVIVRSVQLAPLQKNFFPEAGERISGNLTADVRLSGAGFQWPALGETLNGEGTCKLVQGRIHQLKILDAVADLLQEKSLRDIYYDEVSGNLRMRNGDIMLRMSLDGEQVDVESEGMVGLDGKLALPLELSLSPELAAGLSSRASLSKYLMRQDGAVNLNLYLTGSLSEPEVSLDTAAARERIKKKLTDTIRGKARDEIDKVFGREGRDRNEPGEKASPEEVVNEFIKGVLGE